MTAATAQSGIAEQAPKPEELEQGTTAGTPEDQPLYNAFADEDAELERIEAEIKAEKEAKAKAEQGAGEPQAEPAAAAAQPSQGKPADKPATEQPTPAETGAKAASQNAQTAAIIALRKSLAEEREAKLLAQGQAQAFQAMAAQKPTGEGEAGKETPAKQTPEEELAAIDAEIVALADKFESGDLLAGEWKRQELALQAKARQIHDTRQAAIARETAERFAETATATGMGLDEHAEQLAKDFPVLYKLSEGQIDAITRMVYDQAYLDGREIQPGPNGTKYLRQQIAILAERKFDPERAKLRAAGTPGNANTAGSGQPTAGAQPPAAQQPLKPQPTAEQREAKLRLQSDMPPDIGNLGSGAQAGEISEAAANAALSGNEDEAMRWMEANPNYVNKLLGTNAIRVSR